MIITYIYMNYSDQRPQKYCPVHQHCSHNWYECRLNPANGGNAPVDNQGRYTGPPMGYKQNFNGGPPQNQQSQPNGNQVQANPNGQNGQGNQQSRKRAWQ